MVQELARRTGSTSREERGPVTTKPMPGQNQLQRLLEPFRSEHNRVLKERAKLSYLAMRRSATTQYQAFLYQARLDDLQIELEELESSIANALFANLDGLVDNCLPVAVSRHLVKSREAMIVLPNNPSWQRASRTVLYRMYRGGSFYPLIFPRDVGAEFFRVLSSQIDREGMRGKEIAGRLRKLVLRFRYDLDRTIQRGLEASEELELVGYVRWSWGRGKVVRRAAYAPRQMIDEARRVTTILDIAIDSRAPRSRSLAT